MGCNYTVMREVINSKNLLDYQITSTVIHFVQGLSRLDAIFISSSACTNSGNDDFKFN